MVHDDMGDLLHRQHSGDGFVCARLSLRHHIGGDLVHQGDEPSVRPRGPAERRRDDAGDQPDVPLPLAADGLILLLVGGVSGAVHGQLLHLVHAAGGPGDQARFGHRAGHPEGRAGVFRPGDSAVASVSPLRRLIRGHDGWLSGGALLRRRRHYEPYQRSDGCSRDRPGPDEIGARVEPRAFRRAADRCPHGLHRRPPGDVVGLGRHGRHVVADPRHVVAVGLWVWGRDRFLLPPRRGRDLFQGRGHRRRPGRRGRRAPPGRGREDLRAPADHGGAGVAAQGAVQEGRGG
mmetsp:Transcript_4795/g.14436  ORF Transcript_4795/g.14436 Transcript_4795/m.14436 type:complete len:290 (-) Transcript_4795:1488-2357(-)